MWHSIKSRNIFFLIGLVLLTALLPSVVSAQIITANYLGGPGNTTIIGDWNGDGKTEIGITNGLNWYLDYNGNGAWNAGTDKLYTFGATGWTPVAGDWNGDDHTEIGVYQNGVWYLDYNGNGVWNAGLDKVYNFGAKGWTPVVEDWNNDGKTEVGVYQNGVWYLDYNGNGAWNAGIDKVYNFGAKGWTPVVEDWNGDGKTEVGVYQNGVWYLDYNGNGAWNDGTDKPYTFGATGWTPVAGDWNKDSKTEVGAYRNGVFQLDYNGNGVWNGATVDKQVNFGITGYTPKAGDWNGDGKTNVGLTNGYTWYLDNGDAATPSTPSITVTAPYGGETWKRGTSNEVTWSYTGSPGSTVKIVLLKGGVEVGTIADSAPLGSGGKGTYTWPINPSGTTGSDYKVSVQSTSQPTIEDISNNYFTITSGTITSGTITSGTITSGTTTPSITVTSPNGGETWKRDTSNAVSWSYTGSPGTIVNILLLKGGVEVGTIADSVPIGSSGKGTYTWPINPSGTTGSDYKVSVQSTSQPTIKDMSNTYLTLTPATGTITVSGGTPPATGTITVSGGTPRDGVYIASYAFKYDGSDEVALLKTAIAAANAHPSKTLIFPAGKTISVGTAGVSDPLIEVPRGVTLIGNGCEIKLRNNVHTNGVPWTFMKMQKGSNIYNLKLNGNDVGGNSHNTNGVYIMGGLNGGTQTIDGCEIHGFESYMLGVYANDGPPTNVYITNNKIYNSRQYGITTGCTDGSYCYGHNIVITGNTISDCDQVGVKVRGTYDSRIANNIIHVGRHVSDEPAGIRLYTWDEQNQNVVIENNIITGFDEDPSQGIKGDAPGQYGMTWDTGSRRMTIRNNQISHVNEGIVASLEGATITGNVLTSCAHSIDITPRSGGIANTITRNTCNGSPC